MPTLTWIYNAEPPFSTAAGQGSATLILLRSPEHFKVTTGGEKTNMLVSALRYVLRGTLLGVINRTWFALGHLGLGRKFLFWPHFGMEIPQIEQR